MSAHYLTLESTRVYIWRLWCVLEHGFTCYADRSQAIEANILTNTLKKWDPRKRDRTSYDLSIILLRAQ